jgi:imidazolonepropionase-like amidohydrolase
MKCCTLSIAILLLLSARLPAQQSGMLVLRGVTVIDGTGRAPQPNRNIVIADGRISAITSATIAPPANARVLDLTGRFVIPGLVDAHVHVTSPLHIAEQQDSMLAFLFDSGITTVRDLAGDAIMLRERAELAKSSTLPSPRIFYSALMAGDNFVRTEPRAAPIARGGVPGEVAWLRGLTESTDLAKAVTAAKHTGATAIKIYADLNASLVQRVTAEAHRQGMKVWAHAVVVPAKPGDVVAAGADVISHMQYLVYEANDQLPASVRSIRGIANYSLPVDAPVMTRLLQSMKERGTMLDGTLFQVESAGLRAELDPDRPDLHPMRSWSYAIARRAHEFGIPLVAGTDLMGRPGIDSLSYLHTDIELLVKQVGMTPVQAISAATRNGARSVGREQEQGTIEPGKIADLVVLAADPTADIRNTRGILYVIKGGQPHKRALADHIRALAAARKP